MSELALGIRCERSGDLEGARAAYRRAMISGESHGGAGLRLLRVLMASHAYDDVLALADELDGKTPGATVVVNSAAIPIERARAWLAKGDGAAALVAARDALVRLERSGGAVTGPVELTLADALLALAAALRMTGDLDMAIRACCQAADHSPARAETWAELAGALAASGELEEALDALDGALALAPADGDLFYDQARYRAARGDTHGALQSLAQAIALAVDHRERARTDDDLASLREDPAFLALTRPI